MSDRRIGPFLCRRWSTWACARCDVGGRPTSVEGSWPREVHPRGVALIVDSGDDAHDSEAIRALMSTMTPTQVSVEVHEPRLWGSTGGRTSRRTAAAPEDDRSAGCLLPPTVTRRGEGP